MGKTYKDDKYKKTNKKQRFGQDKYNRNRDKFTKQMDYEDISYVQPMRFK